MSSRKIISIDDPAWSLMWYMRGYYPLYDLLNRFYWERLPERAFVPIDAAVAGHAAKMARRGEKKFRLVKNQHFDACIRHLQDPRVKDFSWVRAEVVRIYKALRSVGMLMTVEAINQRGQLAGGLVAIVLPGVVIAETMFSLEAEASKVCLCKLVGELHERGFLMMDVQTRHDRDPWGEEFDAGTARSPHPCVRLGEVVLPIDEFMPRFSRIIAEGGFRDSLSWLTACDILMKRQFEFLEGDCAGAIGRAAELAREKPEIARAMKWLAIHLDGRFLAALDEHGFLQ